jgi:uncharacterized small protein (DUF1192 family)
MLIGKSGQLQRRGTTMAIFDDEPREKPKPHEIGQDLSLLSQSELTERIELLRREIARLEVEFQAKGTTKSEAEALFKRS